MTKLIFPCTEHEHPMFGKVTRPLIKLAFYSERFQEWLNVKRFIVSIIHGKELILELN